MAVGRHDLLVLPAALVGRVVRGRDGGADEAEAEANAAEAKAMAVAEAMRGGGGERGGADHGGRGGVGLIRLGQ